MNCVTMYGRITKKPELRAINNDNFVCRFSIAVNRAFKTEGGPDADFFECVIFGKRAQVIDKYFDKGSRIAITGRIENNNYTDKNGVKHYSNNIIVTDFDFVDSKSDTETRNTNGNVTDFVDVPLDLDVDLPFGKQA